jgi:aminoglycoside 3-N-acetyltransferase
LRRFLKKIIPSFIIDAYKSMKKKKRHAELEKQRSEGKIITKKDISECLHSLGVKEGDIVMLHSSMSSIGYVEGGAKTLIDAFLDVLAQAGTLVMPSFPVIGFNLDYLKTDPLFDIKNTPSRMGAVTEVFRKMPGVKRSFHPTDPVCALGPKAEYLTKDHYGQLTPYNSQSPFYRLCEQNARIVMLGVSLDTLTNLHTLEDAVENFKYPVYYRDLFECRMLDENGKASVMKTKCHDPEWSKKRKCNDLKPLFMQGGFLKEGKLGNATVMLIEAKEMQEWMLKNYFEKGITMYTPQGS